MRKNKSRLLLAASFAIFATTASADVTDVIEKSFEFDQQGRISLSNVNGNVTIAACDCSQVHLTATITASDQETRDRIEVKINASSKKLSIETKYAKTDHRHSRNNHSEVIYALRVPNKVQLDEIQLVNGDLKISGVSGKLNADMVNGDLISDANMADTEVSMVNGDMKISFQDLTSVERIKLESVNGDIVVKMPSNADLDVSAETVSGDISNDFGIKVHKGRYVGSDMHGRVGNGTVNLSMENVNGKIQLKTL